MTTLTPWRNRRLLPDRADDHVGIGLAVTYGLPTTAEDRARLPVLSAEYRTSAHIPEDIGKVGFDFGELALAVKRSQGHFGGASAHGAMPNGVPFSFAPGCFSGSIGSAEKGEHNIYFQLMHGRRFAIGSTANGAIDLSDSRHALHLRITATPAGRYCRRVLARLPEARELSIGWRALDWTPAESPGGPVTLIRRAVLFEISAVDAGGWPATYLRLTGSPRGRSAREYLDRHNQRALETSR